MRVWPTLWNPLYIFEVTADRKKLRNLELNDVLFAKYYQVDKIKDHETSGEWRNLGESRMRTEFR
jgi:hypothetical protein